MKMQGLIGAALAVAASALAPSALAAAGYAITTDMNLVQFSTSDVSSTLAQKGPLTGFSGSDTALVGVDFRVQDGKLYGVGNAGGIYTIRLANGAMTLVGTLSVPLSGSRFGVDFNPAANRLRIVSDDGQNLRHDLTVTPNVTTIDTALNNGAAPPVTQTGIVGAGYTNNDLSALTATTLFVVKADTGQILLQSPANSGIVVPTANLTVTPDVGTNVGFDIFTRRVEGQTRGHVGFASITSSGVNSLYEVDMLTGQAASLGDFNVSVLDVAFRIRP